MAVVETVRRALSTGPTFDLARTTRYHLLSNPRRIFVVEYLDAHGETSVRELTAVRAAGENDVRLSQVGSAQRKRVYVSLYQTHLPTLDDHDVVEYDADRGIVAPGPHFDDLVRTLTRA